MENQITNYINNLGELIAQERDVDLLDIMIGNLVRARALLDDDKCDNEMLTMILMD